MKQAEITKLSVKDIQGKLVDLSDKLMRMKLTHGVSPIENPIQIKDLRKTVARLNTELTKREAQA
ncbi:MAG: 50S ribosomal protein L29 [Bacteroidetes bacterium]|nr:50S ribosomal protein L29 [Bacteroidota bacterium]